MNRLAPRHPTEEVCEACLDLITAFRWEEWLDRNAQEASRWEAIEKWPGREPGDCDICGDPSTTPVDLDIWGPPAWKRERHLLLSLCFPNDHRMVKGWGPSDWRWMITGANLVHR